MKKIFLIAGILVAGFAGLSRADSTYGSIGQFGNQKLWRSSTTRTNDANVVIASGSIVVGGIICATAGSGSSFELFDGSMSSATATRMTPRYDTTSKFSTPANYLLYFSSGLLYNNTGTTAGEMQILWDWYDTNSVHIR